MAASDMILKIQVPAHLGRKLQASYEPVVEEAVPERLRKLLEALERTEKRGTRRKRGARKK